jgi:hypothetical protein
LLGAVLLVLAGWPEWKVVEIDRLLTGLAVACPALEEWL